MQSYIRVLKYFRPYLGYLAAAIVCLLLATGANLILPWIVKDVIDKVLIQKDVFLLNMIVLAIIASFFAKGLFSYGQVYFMSYATQSVVTNLRKKIYCHLQRLSLDFYEKRQTGEIMSRLTNDVALLQGVLTGGVVEWLTESCTFLGSLALLFYIDWNLALLTVIVLPLIAWLVNKLGRKVRRVAGVVQVKLGDITSILQETISGIRIIKAFAREDYEIAKFSKINQESFSATLKSTRVSAILGPVVEFVGSFGIVAIVWYGGQKVIQGSLTSGDLVAFLIYVITMSSPMNRLSRLYGNAQQAAAAGDRIFEVLDTQPKIKEAVDAKKLPKATGKVEFNNVSFAYETDNLVLQDINLEANPGQVLALVGPSGAGKTTIVDLIPRFYEPCAGAVKIDGQDIRQFTLASLREQIAIVPQDIILFNGTIEDNIAYGRLEATQEEIIQAAKGANAHDFISSLPEGYQTQIGDRGVKLSGGQRQRLAIARAILKNPRILILDEATSALDTESEILVQEALERLMEKRTTFVIAHRLSTIRNAQQILVIDQGKVVETGNHSQLLAQGGLYSRLYEAQFKAQEALNI